MVERDLRNVQEAEYSGVNYIPSEDQDLSLHRDPSFSRWFDEDGRVVHSQPLPSENPDTDADDSSFNLPSLHHVKTGNGLADSDRHQYSIKLHNGMMQLNQDHSLDHENNLHIRGNGKDTYVPFDVENRSSGEISSSTSDIEGAISGGNHRETSPSNSKTLVSAADVLKTLFLIVVWYTFSTFLTLYNKTLLGDDMGKFPAPLLMNTVHFALQAVLSKAITLYWSHRFRPPVAMSWRDYFVRVVPTALGTALDINLSNASLILISVTFATMCKSAAPIFLLLFAFAFRLESPSIKLLGIIVVISIGVLLTVAKETEFDFWGFVFVMLASVMSGFRWTMTQILLQKEAYGLENPLTFMSYVTPVMAIATLLLSFMLDPWQELKMTNYFNSPWHIGLSCLLMLFGGALAFFMVLTEFILISVTSAVTVTIAGVVKEAVTILVAVFYFNDKFTWLKGAGLFVIMFGVSLFNWYKYEKLKAGQTHEDDLAGRQSSNVAAKYVILEEMDDQEDSI